MFEDATFSSRGAIGNKAPQWMLLTMTLNLAVVAMLIVLPLLYPEVLPMRMLSRVLFAPVPPAAPLSQPKAQAMPTRASASPQNLLAMPMRTPARIFEGKMDPDAPPSSSEIGLDQGNGVIGSADPAASLFKASPAPAVKLVRTQKVVVGGNVAEGLLLTKTTPTYPVIAKTVHVSGTVVLAAVIAKDGSIENLRVVSGPAMLQSAAIDAVQRWKYRPYLLNGLPVEVETTIHVVFSLGR